MQIEQIIDNQGRESHQQIQEGRQAGHPVLGVLTKTLATSPVIQWILPARIRHKDKDDIVFVGEDYIDIKHTEKDGSLTHVATKSDFDCRILAARVLGDPVDEDDDDDDDDEDDEDGDEDDPTLGSGIKLEYSDIKESSHPETTMLPPQCLVLTLETNQIVFLFACENAGGSVNFDMASSIPFPAFPHPHQRLGKYLAIDPKSRAIAVAAAEDNVFLYSSEPMSTNVRWGPGFLPVSCERSLKGVRGVIQQMEFLHPPDSDPDHVILLLVVSDKSLTSLVRVDWLYSTGVLSARVHNPLPIQRTLPSPNLLIPINSSAAFLLAIGPEVWVYTNILTGHVSSPAPIEFPKPTENYKSSGNSPSLPRWVAWARPRRIKGPLCTDDYLYLAREDGSVFYLVLTRNSPENGGMANHVGTFACYIESAFGCFGSRQQHDILAMGGNMSVGYLHNIMPSQYSASGSGAELTSVLPNWVPVFDLIASRLPPNKDGTIRSRDVLFTPGGRQPYGRISELRFGLEARSSLIFQEKALPSVIKLWPLFLEEDEDLLFLLTTPTDSRVLRIPSNAFDGGDISVVDGPAGFDTGSRTLAAAVISDDYIMQITESKVVLSRLGVSNLLEQSCPQNSKYSASAIDDEHSIAIISVRKDGRTSIDLLHIDTEQATLKCLGTPKHSAKEFISAIIFKCLFGLVAAFGTSDSSVEFYGLSPTKGPELILDYELTAQDSTSTACDDLVILIDPEQRDCGASQNILLLCGLREGNLHAVELVASKNKNTPLAVSSTQTFRLGLTSIKLSLDHDIALGSGAYATCGNGLFRIGWSGAGSSKLALSEVWLVDARDPSLQQAAVTAFAVVQPHHLLRPELASALILTSGDTCHITKVRENRPKVVPRSLAVNGTPTRVIYSKSYACFVTVGSEFSVHDSVSTHSSTSRSTRPAVHFKASGLRDWEYVHYLSPGAHVYSMVEWNYEDPPGKKRSFILLGTGYVANTVSSKGEVLLLQPTLRDGTVVDVRSHKVKVLDNAVYALGLYGRLGLVACTKPWTYLYEYQPGENNSRFVEVCKFRTSSPGVYVTATPPLINISTADDSLVTLCHDIETNNLKPIGLDARGRKSAYHLALDIPNPSSIVPSSQASAHHHTATRLSLSLVTTRDCRLVGMLAPSPAARSITHTVHTVFSATLRKSLIRTTRANIRPPWKAQSVTGVLEDRIIGVTVDGTLAGAAILESTLTDRLRWVQKLCERSKRICPMATRHSVQGFKGDFDEENGPVPLPPPGFESNGTAAPRLRKPEEMHVNGDILQRLLDRGGVSLLQQIMMEETARKDRLGDWMTENLESQKALASSLIELIGQVLDRWW